MLLEYNEDTDENTLHERAIQLRHRVAGRKLDASVESNSLTVDDLLFMREKNREAIKEHGKDELAVTEVLVKDRISLVRTEQHFKAVGQVSVLGKDVARASRLSKARLDSLNDLEKRIMTMRGQLQAPSVPLVDSAINTELQTNNKLVKLEGKFDTCSICNRRILLALLPTHKRMCEVQAKETALAKLTNKPKPGGVSKLDVNIVTSLATFKPQPPRNFRAKEIGISFICWEWDPPVVDGGLEITDYEIMYDVHFSIFQREIGKFKKWDETVGPFSTSNWVFRNNPVCNTGYKVMDLRADTDHVNFRIRSMNLRGWSDWVPMQVANVPEVLRTRPSVPATPPLHVMCEKITSSCLHLSWGPPLFDGGVPITDYFVHYTVVEMQITVTARDVRVEKKKSFCTESTETTAVIRHLPEDCDIIDVYVVARNFDLHLGAPGYAKLPKEKKAFRTAQSSRYARLLRELDFCANVTEDYVDSTFFTGIKQRCLRVEHMRKLKDELSVTPPDPLEVEEAKEWAAVVERANLRKQLEEEALRLALELSNKTKAVEQEDNEHNPREHGHLGFTFKQRHDQYERKIKSLEQKMVALVEERGEIDRKRIQATLQMRMKEKRMMQLQLETERLKGYPGDVITSSVLVGADMQYNIGDFRRRCEKVVNDCIQEIAALKFSVITGENRRHQIKVDLEKAEEHRKERIAKFHEFESNYQKTMKIMHKFNPEQAEERLRTLYFRRLQQFCNARKALRAQISHTFQQVMLRYLRTAFHKWSTGEQDMSSQNTRAHASVGGILLQKAFEKRQELQDLLRATISDTAVIKQKLELSHLSKDTRRQLQSTSHFKHTEEGIDHQKLFRERGLTLLYEGDGYAQENKFELAAGLYEAQIMLLRSTARSNAARNAGKKGSARQKTGGVDIKALAICHGRLGKMFAKLGNASRAIVEFDRQLSLAREIQDKAEESDAFYGLGAGYFQNNDYDNSIRYLTIAQAQYLSLGRVQRYIWTLRTLKECYVRLNKPDKVAVYEEKLFDAENSANKTMQLMHQRLDDMKSKLVHSAAEIELVVNIERTTYRALELRKEIALCDDRMKDLEGEIEAQEQLCMEIVALLEAIQKELDEAIKTDATEMWSALVHDQPQVVEIEELKTRLKQRGPQEIARLEAEKLVKRNLLVRMKNLQNDVFEADQQLQLEEGALMKHARLDRSFRCVGLCATNVAGNEVTGTATGGYEAFAATEGSNIHLIDYHSGELLHIFLGGNEETGHTGIITCLLHDGAQLFTGSTDETIICWDTMNLKMLRRLEGHEGGIVSLASESHHFLVSAAADTTMRLWDKHTGDLLRVIFGHAKSVLAMEVGATWLLTGSADHEVRVWKITTKEAATTKRKLSSAPSEEHGNDSNGLNMDVFGMEKITPASEYAPQLNLNFLPPPPVIRAPTHTGVSDKKGAASGKVTPGKPGAVAAAAAAIAEQAKEKKHKHHHHHHARMKVTVEVGTKLVGHEVPVTCVKYGNMEVLSGDVLGRIFIWWLTTGQILRKCQVHQGPVKAIQFDSVHIVSGGTDAAVCITDIATGEPLQSLRGHTKAVLAMAFDSERILSVGGDNTVRYWTWGKKSGPQDKLHVLAPAETLAMVAKTYQLTVDQLMKWNGITESRQCHPGMKLIVKKGDPNSLTAAEKQAAERELRKSRGMARASKKLKGAGAKDEVRALKVAMAERYHRVQTLAMDQDPFSLNNRLFGHEKRQLELFPDTTLDHGEEYSLGARILAAAETGNDPQADALRKQNKHQRAVQRAIRYFISTDNEDEWGSVADELGATMIEMMVELIGYEVVIEAKNAQRSRFSVMGRISIYQDHLHSEQERQKKLRLEAEAEELLLQQQQQQEPEQDDQPHHQVNAEEDDGHSVTSHDRSYSSKSVSTTFSMRSRETDGEALLRRQKNEASEQRRKERKQLREAANEAKKLQHQQQQHQPQSEQSEHPDGKSRAKRGKSILQSIREDAINDLQQQEREDEVLEGQIVHSLPPSEVDQSVMESAPPPSGRSSVKLPRLV